MDEIENDDGQVSEEENDEIENKSEEVKQNQESQGGAKKKKKKKKKKKNASDVVENGEIEKEAPVCITNGLFSRGGLRKKWCSQLVQICVWKGVMKRQSCVEV